ncbi:Transcription initiation factor TFIID subunit 9 [Cryomyces antarcticus]|uniref:Transcription initiation factor TFIID subunit 9 n=1 Tax=Cryomyces antarcticus TaxID=329879 RepID=A0ABR0LYQ7_9PEZI|nr:Transcription initiation factor TFIID subunit 9 [Cryomyces antarcticus]KAK5256732.1 Transcription initiation factor TFIID subunit 9 [Cryomyces antarcticus]
MASPAAASTPLTHTNGAANGTTPPLSQPAPTPSTNTALPQTDGPPSLPLTSTTDDGSSRRPRDARLLHLVLSSLGVSAYQERVPLQLMDFAYRYTSSILSDSLRLASEGYSSSTTNTTSGSTAKEKSDKSKADENGIGVAVLRQAIGSRLNYQFNAQLPKEFMLEQAADRNRIALPRVVDRGFGVALPPERYCLTGVGWGLKDEWDSEEEEEEGGEQTTMAIEGGDAKAARKGSRSSGADTQMDGVEEAEEDEDGQGGFEDVMDDGDGDREMGDG